MNLRRAVLLLLCLLLLCRGTAFADEAKPARRVVSLAPNLTEDIFALGRGDWLVGVSDFCLYPPEAAKIARVGGLYNTNLELIITLQPDLIVHLPSHDAAMKPLERMGIRTLSVRSETIEDVYTGIKALGKALDAEDRAAKLEASIRSRLAAIGRRIPREKKTVLYVIGYSPAGLREIYVAGPDTFLDEMVRAARGENLMKDSIVRYPTVSREFLVAHPPDVLIDNNNGAGERSDATRDVLRKAWLDFLGPAGKDKTRISFCDDPHVTVPGPAVADAVEEIALMIHGQLLPEPTPAPCDE